MTTERKSRLLMNRIVDRINTHTNRLRLLEQSANTLSSRINNLEQAFNKQQGESKATLSALDAGLKKQAARLDMIDNRLREMAIQMKRFATRIDVKSLERMIDMYSPLESEFVTREEVEQLIEEKTKKR